MPYHQQQQQAIIVLKHEGIIKGYQGEIFPDNTLQRYEMALMIDRISTIYHLYDTLPIQQPHYIPYTDVQINDPELQEALKNLQKYAIMKGNNGKFFPTQQLTGEQLLALFGRLLYGLHDAVTKPRRGT